MVFQCPISDKNGKNMLIIQQKCDIMWGDGFQSRKDAAKLNAMERNL